MRAAGHVGLSGVCRAAATVRCFHLQLHAGGSCLSELLCAAVAAVYIICVWVLRGEAGCGVCPHQMTVSTVLRQSVWLSTVCGSAQCVAQQSVVERLLATFGGRSGWAADIRLKAAAGWWSVEASLLLK